MTTLWGQIRLNVGAFMQGLFLQGAFAGTTPQQAYFVKCDGENNPSSQHRPGDREYPGRLRSACIRPNSWSSRFSRWPVRTQSRRETRLWRSFPRIQAPRPLQGLQISHQVGRQICAGGQQDEQLEAHHGSRGTSRRRAIPPPPQDLPDASSIEAITLERGLTQDMAFHDWAGLVWNFGAALGSEVSLANFRKNIYLEFYNEAGQLVIAYKIYRCWVSEYQALPDLDANANADRHRAHQAGKRRMGARYRRYRTGQSQL